MRLRGKASRFTIAVLVAGFVLGACSSSKKASSGGSSSTVSSSTPSGTTINIGVVGSASGPQASSSGQYETVAPAWEAWVNANGGINGHPVKVITEDDGGDAATAQSQVNTLLSSDQVVAIVVGSDNEVTSFDGAAISKGVPLISGVANSTDWYSKVGMFPTPTGVVPGLGDQVAAAKAAGAKVFANLYCAEIAACQQASPLLQSAAKAAGLGYTELSISSTAPSYTAQCVELQQKKVDYAQLNFTTSAAVKFIQDCQAQGYNPTWGSSAQAVGPSLYSLPNLTVYGPAYAFLSTADAPPAATFRSVMEKYAKNSNWREGTASFTWDGLMALESALKTATAGGASATSTSVEAGLYALKGSTLNGELANPIGWVQGKSLDLLTYNPCYFTLEIKGGQLTAPNGLTPQCPAKTS
jgi:branched-chain amino acid transport system substrate-binding protein